MNVDVLSTTQSLKTIDRSNLAQDARGQLRFYRAAIHPEDSQRLGSHAKFCISDEELAYVGSSNLTGPGLSGQLEMGVMIRGPVARHLVQFWDYAVDIGLIVLVR